MRVKMLASLSGPKLSLVPGDEFDFADYEAERLIEAGFAEISETDSEKAARLEAARTAAEAEHQAKIETDAAAKDKDSAKDDASAEKGHEPADAAGDEPAAAAAASEPVAPKRKSARAKAAKA